MPDDALSPIEREIVGTLEVGLITGEPRLVKAAVNRIPEVSFEGTSSTFFSRLIDILDNPAFASATGTDHFLFAFIADWDELQPTDRSKLLTALERVFPQMHDEMGCFFAAELLGRHYCNADALAVLERVRDRSPARQRASVPHGLHLLVRECPDPTTVARAHAALLGMQNDESADVREEVAEALKAIET